MIDQVILENFKCFERETEIRLARLNLLAGLNGMGKSTVLQALVLLRQSQVAGADNDEPRLILNGSLINLGTAKDVLCESAETETISIGFAVANDRFIWRFAYDEQADELIGGLDNPIDVPVIPLFTDRFHYLRAERLGPRTAFPLSATAVRDHRQLGRDGEYAAFFLSSFGSEDIQDDNVLHPDAPSHQLRHQVEAWLGEISPGTRIYTESHPGLDLVNLQYAFVSPLGETNHYRATNVGFGLTYILPIIVAALASPVDTLLLLENPEAHLHPKGQAQMGRLLALAAARGLQIIVETHSDHLLNGVRLAVHSRSIEPELIALHYFEREAATRGYRAKITRPTIDSDGRIDVWPEGFFDESDKALRKLLVPPE